MALVSFYFRVHPEKTRLSVFRQYHQLAACAKSCSWCHEWLVGASITWYARIWNYFDLFQLSLSYATRLLSMVSIWSTIWADSTALLCFGVIIVPNFEIELANVFPATWYRFTTAKGAENWSLSIHQRPPRFKRCEAIFFRRSLLGTAGHLRRRQ